MSTAKTRGSRPGELHRRRVVLLAESAGLAAVLNHVLDPADRLTRLGSLRELAEGRALDTADVVVLDLCDVDRSAAIGQVRRRYQGPLVVLVGRGDDSSRLRLDDACTLLDRPFSANELGAALAVPGRPAARRAPSWRAPAAAPGRLELVDRARGLLVTLTEGWQARRRVRVAGFSVFALVAFTVAFALASQRGCGPGCDAFGTGFSPAPSIAPSESSAPSTTGPKRATSTTARPAVTSGSGAFAGVSSGRLATTTTATARVTTTSRKPVTTRPATTQSTTQSTAPTTTAPTTTQTTAAPPTAGSA